LDEVAKITIPGDGTDDDMTLGGVEKNKRPGGRVYELNVRGWRFQRCPENQRWASDPRRNSVKDQSCPDL
jgi:hypothetical protein